MLDIATTRILLAPEHTDASNLHGAWVWPLPRLDGVAPCVLASIDEIPRDSVDIGYAEHPSSSACVPVLAAQDGVITYAGTAAGSPTVCLDHAGGWSTQYADLEHVLALPTDRFRRRRKPRVRAGDVLGHARRSSLRIRFGLAQLGESGWHIVDPTALLPTWSVLSRFAEPIPRVGQRRAA
jgi:hypothetical protein